jgi:uncharacterized protein
MARQPSIEKRARNPRSNKCGAQLFFSSILLFSLLFQAGVASSQSSKKFLWETRSPKNTVYLLGSIHLLSKGSYPLPQQFEKAYRDSATVVFEADLDEAKGPKTQELVFRLGGLPDGESLRETISEDTHRLLEKRASALGLDITALQGLRPWLCALSLAAAEYAGLGFDPQYGIDKHFFDRAKKDGKKILALETIEEQLHIFSDMTATQQESLLRQTLEELDATEKLFREMILAWDQGDAERLHAMTRKGFEAYPDIYREVFVRRNSRWADRIERLLNQKGKVLVIVGAGHLAGPDSVISLLSRKGFRIAQR